MKIQKYFAIALLATAFTACQQEEIAPNSGNQTPDVQVVEGEGGPVTLSGMLTYDGYQTDESANKDSLRSVSYQVPGNNYNYRYPGGVSDTYNPTTPFFEGNTTTLTCIIRSTDATKPISAFDIEWKNTDKTTVQLSNQPITLASGTDLTQGDWYLLAFVSTNGGASGQTFTFDKSTGKLTIAAPSNYATTSFYDYKVLNGTCTDKDGNTTNNTYSGVPALFTSSWVKLNVTGSGSNVEADLSEMLQLKPLGSLLRINEHYYMDGLDQADYLNGDTDLTTKRYLTWNYSLQDVDDSGRNDTKKRTYAELLAACGQSAINQDNGYTYQDFLGEPYFKEATSRTIKLHESIALEGTYHFYESDYGPGSTSGAYIFTRKGQSVAERKAELAANTILTSSEVNNGRFNTYTFTNNAPHKSEYRFTDATTTNLTYSRYLWVNGTRPMYNNEYINRRPAWNGKYDYDQIFTQSVQVTDNATYSRKILQRLHYFILGDLDHHIPLDPSAQGFLYFSDVLTYPGEPMLKSPDRDGILYARYGEVFLPSIQEYSNEYAHGGQVVVVPRSGYRYSISTVIDYHKYSKITFSTKTAIGLGTGLSD